MRSQCAHWLRNDRALQGVRYGIGGRTEASAPTEGLQGVRCGEESPSHGFAVPAPFRQGGRGGGGTDCHDQFANWLRNDRLFARGTVGFFVVRRGGALLPTVVPTDSRALSCPPIGALPRNRLASSATGGASPISPPAGDRKGRPYGKRLPLSGEPLGVRIATASVRTGFAMTGALQGVQWLVGGGTHGSHPTEVDG